MPRWSASNEDVIKCITMLVQEIQVTVFIIVPVAYANTEASYDVISAMLVSLTSPL